MSYKVTDNTGNIIINTRQKAAIFLRKACDFLIVESTPNTPMSAGADKSGAKKGSGNLRRDILKQVLGMKAVVKWRKDYAAYQERGRRFDGSHPVRNYTTPGTGPHFAANAAKIVSNRGMEIAKASGLI